MRSTFLELISEYPFPVVSRLGVRWFPTVAVKFLQKLRLRKKHDATAAVYINLCWIDLINLIA